MMRLIGTPDGLARLKRFDRDNNLVEVTYFMGPGGEDSYRSETLEVASLETAKLFENQRVYWNDPENGGWRAGRLTNAEEISPAALGRPESEENHYSIRFPGKDDRFLPLSQCWFRSNHRVKNPMDYLREQVNESPYWHPGRTAFVAAMARQRAVYRGLTGLASSSIDLHHHQIRTVSRILLDPIPRYLLADEVGLGKTIEAGVVIRQHCLDYKEEAKALLVVPGHLLQQWQGELVNRFHLKEHLDTEAILLVPHDDLDLFRKQREGVTLLLVDEAHQAVQGAYAEGQGGACYRALAEIAKSAQCVLLLSATPVLHNEDGFLAMLHLLDPATHDLGDLPLFHDRVARRQTLAEILQTLTDDSPAFFLEGTLDSLGGLYPDDPGLSCRIEALRPLIDEEEDPERVAHIRALRTYAQEAHQLHKRMLRTRRESEEVAPDLPERNGEIECFEDPAWDLVNAFIERWRLEAAVAVNGQAQEDEAKLLFADWVAAALIGPAGMRQEVAVRVGQIEGGRKPLFEGELQLLEETRRSLDPETMIDRVAALASFLARDENRGRWVVFVDSHDAAGRVASSLSQNMTGVASYAGASEFPAGTRVLVCSRLGEEGLNLHLFGNRQLHLDLPLYPNRIEQRIGRQDRLGAGSKNVRVVCLVARGTYEEAWARCLRDGIKIFDKSRASLQHILDDYMKDLRDCLLHEGMEAIEDKTETWGGESNKGLEAQMNRIRAEEALELFTAETEAEADLYEGLDEYEFGGGFELQEINELASELLLFRKVDCGAGEKYVYTRGRSQLTVGDYLSFFRDSMPKDERVRGATTLSTLPFTLDRSQAVRTQLGILRVGHPFLEALSQYMEAQDRGIAYAFWRNLPPQETERGIVAQLYFRFDFILEGQFSTLCHLFEGNPNVSLSALRRQLDQVFPPQACTVWTDEEFEAQQSPPLWVTEPYQKGPDVSITHKEERWATLEKQGLFSDWASYCDRSLQVGMEAVAVQAQLEESRCKAIAQLETRLNRHRVQLEARRGALDAIRLGEEQREFALQEEVLQAMQEAILQSEPRLDSVGAIFLSTENPFVQREPIP